MSIQTSNFYIQAVKQFCQWMVRNGRAPESPLAHLQGGNVPVDHRHDRRAWSDGEVTRLIDVAEHGPAALGMDGPTRAMLYRSALGTGFRASESGSLFPPSFRLDDTPPTIIVEAAYSKRRRRDYQPIRRDLSSRLRFWLVGKSADVPVFKMPRKPVMMLRVDLETVGIDYDTDAGFADFQALRHTFLNNLARKGVHPKNCQTLARHSTITLTMDRYSHSVLGDLAVDLEALPSLESSGPDREQQRATGTCDIAPKSLPISLPKSLPIRGAPVKPATFN